jgi:hypothetical protein
MENGVSAIQGPVPEATSLRYSRNVVHQAVYLPGVAFSGKNPRFRKVRSVKVSK